MTRLGRDLVTALLLGPSREGRLVPDSPIRGDVWAAFAAAPREPVRVLIEAQRDIAAGTVAARLAERCYAEADHERAEAGAEGFGISVVEGFVAANLTLAHLVLSVLPMTAWCQGLIAPERRAEQMRALRDLLRSQLEAMGAPADVRPTEVEWMPGIARMAATFRMIGALVWASGERDDTALQSVPDLLDRITARQLAEFSVKWARQVLDAADEQAVAMKLKGESAAEVFAVSRNRPVELAIDRSVKAIKADAASQLFSISCERIGWAVLDTGIDGSHKAFFDEARELSRVKATYDFTMLSQVVQLDHLFNEPLLDRNVAEIGQAYPGIDPGEIKADLKRLAEGARDGRSINWPVAEKYLKPPQPGRPSNPHGTHVAGIIGARWPEDESERASNRGICPDIKLFDFRVVADNAESTEFAVVGALQFIRFLNGRNNTPQIHGANISLSIRHDVRNYACGRTPVCEEAERLASSGVVVVAAAGNRGYQNYSLADGGSFETYAPASITDPGNAEAIITVGATHRFAPHNYGVSFFSSRGPTGDGRAKPDLVAPGEKIWSTVPGHEEDAMSGTSMAAPHVSGAAALLMARNAEFIGQSARIKRILCQTATDLGRERAYQGAGMLDVLRAMQSI